MSTAACADGRVGTLLLPGGRYGAYQLQRGYKLPLLMLTNAEAVASALGLLADREFRFPVDLAAAAGALATTERVMPE